MAHTGQVRLFEIKADQGTVYLETYVAFYSFLVKISALQTALINSLNLKLRLSFKFEEC